MTLLLSRDDVSDLATDQVVLESMRAAFRAEANGLAELPVRLDAPSPTGFFRTMPAVLDDVMGCKIMTLVRGQGTRYLVMLYSVETGGCLAIIDADVLTKARTAGTTALAALHMLGRQPGSLSVVGTGFEAQGHLRYFSSLWPLEEVWAYSRSEENRRTFAEAMSDSLGITVRAVASVDEAVSASDTVLLATKSPEPVVDGSAFRPGSVVLSIGSTRPDLRELDRVTFERASTLVVDAVEQVLADSGDVMEAVDGGVVTEDRVIALASLVAEDRVLPRAAAGDRDLTVFKSAGTALQDLALARELYRRSVDEGRGRDLGEVSELKPFK